MSDHNTLSSCYISDLFLRILDGLVNERKQEGLPGAIGNAFAEFSRLPASSVPPNYLAIRLDGGLIVVSTMQVLAVVTFEVAWCGASGVRSSYALNAELDVGLILECSGAPIDV